MSLLLRSDRARWNLAVVALGALFTLALGTVSHAQLLIYEGFDYPVSASTYFPDPPAGVLNGGTGWSAGWFTVNGGVPTGPKHILGSSVGYTDSNGNALQTTGGAIDTVNWTSIPMRVFDVAGIVAAHPELGVDGLGHDLGGYGGTQAGGDLYTSSLWISFTARGLPDQIGGEQQATIDFRHGETPTDYGIKFMSLGRPSDIQIPQLDPKGPWGAMRHDDDAANPNGETRFQDYAVPTTNNTIFLVARLDFLGPADKALGALAGDPLDRGANYGTDLSLWIDPNLDSTPSAASAFVDQYNLWQFFFDRITWDGNASTQLDEFRIGLNYADVAPFTAAPAGVPGDYNGNGIVDAADYVVWRNTLGSTTALAADGDHNGTVQQADFDYWRARFGNTAGSGAGGSNLVASVPEPASWLLASMLTLAAIGFGRRRAAGR